MDAKSCQSDTLVASADMSISLYAMQVRIWLRNQGQLLLHQPPANSKQALCQLHSLQAFHLSWDQRYAQVNHQTVFRISTAAAFIRSVLRSVLLALIDMVSGTSQKLSQAV